MSLWTRFLHRERKEHELDEEIDAHLSMDIQERVEQGESLEAARSSARRDFGNVALVKEVTRDGWGWAWLERLLRDQRYILRQMRRNPGFAAVSIAVLALGLGATIAMFSIVNSVLLEPMGFAHADRLYVVLNVPPPRAQSSRHWHVNARHVHEWRTGCTSCEDVAMAEGIGLTLTGTGEPERVPALRISYNFFRTLGVRPAIGRDFQPEEELPGQSRVVILADSMWRSRFAGDPGIVGRMLDINAERYTVVGVLPPEFRLPVGDQWGGLGQAIQPLMFCPLGMDISQARGAGTNNFISVLRLRPGVQAAQTLAELDSLIAHHIKQFGIELKTVLFPLKTIVTRHARAGLWLLLAMGVAVWLIVCVNVANLVLVRTAGRDREAGIRLALGSSRAELFRLVLNEALLLVAIGSGVGLLLAYAALQAFVAWAPPNLPRLADIQMSSRTWLFAIATAGLSTMICGVLPAWRLTSRNPQVSLKEGSSTATAEGRKVRMRELMLAAEVALSTVLLVVGGLLTMSFVNVMRAPKGFDVAHVITQAVSLSGARFTDPERIRFVDDALARLAAIPRVRAVGVTNRTPLQGETWVCDLRDAGAAQRRGVAAANFRFVSPGYWSALGIPLRRGRLLEAADRNRPVAVIGERAAQLLWPGLDPLGRRVGECGPDSLEVIGVVGDVWAQVEREAPPTVYQPHWDSALSRPLFVVRTDGEPAAVAGSVRAALRSPDGDVPISPAITMEEILDEVTATRRFQMNLVVAFAVVALFLASLGIYGVVSFTVAQTTPEIGIRMALGAHAREVTAMILRRGLVPVLGGLAVGLVGAFVTTRLISSQLYGVMPHDVSTMSVVSMVLIVVAVCACWIPARRATRISPLRALRFE
jgi:predicted permease